MQEIPIKKPKDEVLPQLADLGNPWLTAQLANLKPDGWYKQPPLAFVRIDYAPGEVIMPRGVYSDYAALLLEGRVEAYQSGADLDTARRSLQSCWRRPGGLRRRIEDFVLRHTDWQDKFPDCLPAPADKTIGQRLRAKAARLLARGLRRLCRGYFDRLHRGDEPLASKIEAEAKPVGTGKSALNPQGELHKARARLMGVTAAMWNLRRTMTLVAASDCKVLLLHRRVLLAIEQHTPGFREHRAEQFLTRKLPLLLTENRLFRDKLYVGDVVDWPGLLAQLRGPVSGPTAAALHRVRVRLVQRGAGPWLTEPEPPTLDASLQQRIVSQINDLLKDVELYDAGAWPEAEFPPEAKTLLGKTLPRLTQNERIRFNRLLLSQACGGTLTPPDPGWPLSEQDCAGFIAFFTALQQTQPNAIELLHFARGARIYQTGDKADGLYLLISGKVRVTRQAAGRQQLVNQLEQHAFFGVSCVEADATHSADVDAIGEADVVRLAPEAVRALRNSPFAIVLTKLEKERQRQKVRARNWATARTIVPVDPPEAIASRLLVVNNLLLIDMDRCTRCDQCVRACADAHEGVSRFHRANPELRFNRWEVARACVHCSDAPCQKVCPVGAITFFKDDVVQIHRSRCIGCSQCVVACPFDAIELLRPQTLDDTAKPKWFFKPDEENPWIANKCDLCLHAEREPPCVYSCPYDAAHRGSPRQLLPDIKKWDEDRFDDV